MSSRDRMSAGATFIPSSVFRYTAFRSWTYRTVFCRRPSWIRRISPRSTVSTLLQAIASFPPFPWGSTGRRGGLLRGIFVKALAGLLPEVPGLHHVPDPPGRSEPGLLRVPMEDLPDQIG